MMFTKVAFLLVRAISLRRGELADPTTLQVSDEPYKPYLITMRRNRSKVTGLDLLLGRRL